jgi:hypothetical protein
MSIALLEMKNFSLLELLMTQKKELFINSRMVAALTVANILKLENFRLIILKLGIRAEKLNFLMA